MFSKNFFVIFLLLVATLVRTKIHKHVLTVYYESFSTNSKSFILNQLQPAMKLLHEHIKIEFVPFGKATSLNFGKGEFKCQHGPKECMGNMLQDCTLYYMKDRSELEKVAYVACAMGFRSAARSLSCVNKAPVDIYNVTKCLHSGQGKELQLLSEKKTKFIKPGIIPTVTLDGLFDMSFQIEAQAHLYKLLCRTIENVTCEEEIKTKERGYVETQINFLRLLN